MSNVTALPTSGRMSRVDYQREREAIREAYGETAGEAEAKADQALAKLFYRSGWTQQELAKVEGKSQQTISEALQFGRFLEFTGSTGISEIRKLTRSKFNGKNGYWHRTDKAETNERIRFQEVARLIEGSSLRSPQRKIIGPQLVESFADGKWHKPPTMAKRLGTDEQHVVDTLTQMHSRPGGTSGANCEKRQVGKHTEFRIFRRDRLVSAAEAVEKLTPIIGELKELSRRAPGTVDNPTVARLAVQLEKLLKEWRE